MELIIFVPWYFIAATPLWVYFFVRAASSPFNWASYGMLFLFFVLIAVSFASQVGLSKVFTSVWLVKSIVWMASIEAVFISIWLALVMTRGASQIEAEIQELSVSRGIGFFWILLGFVTAMFAMFAPLTIPVLFAMKILYPDT